MQAAVDRHHVQSLDELRTAFQAEWGKLGKDCLLNLAKSMPRRLQAVIDGKGEPTGY